MHVIGANVSGTMQLPLDGVIEIAFDRYLDPGTVNRQGITLRDINGNAPDSPLIDYDPITRVVSVGNPAPGQPWLMQNQFYRVAFPIATSEAGSFGLRAIDGATIDPNDPSSASITFSVGPAANAPPLPTIDFCADVMPIFNAGGGMLEGACASNTCHGVPLGMANAAQGLVLDTTAGIRATAIGILAEETATGALTTPLASPPVFPAGMPIIDPGNPGNSYLIYKLLKTDDGGDGGAGINYTVPVNDAGCNPITMPFDYGPTSTIASSDENARLADLVPGRRMPWGNNPLSIDQMERIRLWILQGAEVDECACAGTQQ